MKFKHGDIVVRNFRLYSSKKYINIKGIVDSVNEKLCRVHWGDGGVGLYEFDKLLLVSENPNTLMKALV